MAFVINTNIMSINAQNNLRKTQSPLATAMQRLSSGLRVNSAADDAAGLAIATSMDSQTRGLTVGVRNANDGLSMVQTAEGAMNEITNNLQRVRELGVQAMSGQYGVTDVAYMQKEVNSLVEEIGRISEQTKFNGVRLLAGGFDKSIGTSYAASDAMVRVTVTSLNTDTLGGKTFMNSPDGLKDGVKMFLKDIHTISSTNPSTQTFSTGNFTYAAAPAGTYLDGKGAPPNWTYNHPTTATSPFAVMATGHIQYSGFAAFMINQTDINTGVTSLVNNASNAIAVIDEALNTVNSAKADMGAKSNQFEAAINNISNVIQTTQASRSRIMDADFATETANLTKSMILQQAGISVLSQANSSPQNVLALLK
ncbi:flagellin N-terminal helical domain-containing protein [Candidatus Magnetomonas plexicatena]|uniref:flagellin N-terminal helical domain-containing protein n=1 Tax=Candidatus Magnetomonas plexicatena TaxID=2552947 RepID=UPI001C789B32|nr:flagellin FliC [Nitrospirales bacterium LBB_01]